jgi:hypothetical protein
MDSQPITDSFQKFLFELEELSHTYDELIDTDVREALHLTLNYFFVWGKEHDRLPISYCMFSRNGNQAVAQAVKRFLAMVGNYADLDDIPLGQARLDLLQNSSIRTLGEHLYDEFIGHVDQG